MEEASRYLERACAPAPRLALATFLCVVSPIALILLGGLSEYTAHITENAAAGIGLSVLIVLVAAAVGIFLTCGVKAKAFSFLETEPFETEYGVSGMVRQRQAGLQPTANRLNMIGTILCIMSVLPLFLAMCLSSSDLMYIGAVCLLLGFVALACLAFVSCGDGDCPRMEKLLEEAYTPAEKVQKPPDRDGQCLLLADRDCYFHVLHLRSVWQRAGKIQLVHLGDRRHPVRRRNGRSPSGRTGRKKEIKST